MRWVVVGNSCTNCNCDCNCACSTCCFPFDTEIALGDGSHQLVGDVAVGERIKTAFGGEATVLAPIVCHVPAGEVTIEINGAIRMTREHLVRGEGGWLAVDLAHYRMWQEGLRAAGSSAGIDSTRVRQLEVGQLILTEAGPVAVERLERHVSQQDETLLSFELDGDRTFFANGYAVESKTTVG